MEVQKGPPRQDRGLLEIFENKIVKKVPQTSVAPTYKLTLPSEFVVANLSHLVDQSFELTNKEGTAAWKVALLPRRNKNKFEYTLQGWKAFALAHGVNTGDRLQMELLPDGQRMRAHIVRRAVLRDRVPSDPGPALPTLMDVACAAKRSLDAQGGSPSSSGQGGNEDEGSDSPMRSSRQTDASQPRQNSASWSSGPSSADRQLRGRFQEPARRGFGRRKSSGGAAHALEAGSGQQQPPGSARLKLEHEGSTSLRSAAAAVQRQGAGLEALQLGEAAEPGVAGWAGSPHLAVATPQQREHGAPGEAMEEDANAGGEHDWEAPTHPRSAFARKGKQPDSLGGSPVHQKRQRSGLLPPSSGSGGHAAASATILDTDQARSRGMQLLFSAADELNSSARRAGNSAPAAAGQSPAKLTISEGLQTDAQPAGGGGGAAGESRSQGPLPARMAEVLEAQTSRGLIVVSALLKLAERMAAPELLGGATPAAAGELRAIHAELKQHTNEVLDAMWHMRNVQRQP